MATSPSSSDRGGTASAADALAQLFAGPLGTGLAPAAKAARAWYAANGDRERRHTTGVWLKKSGRAGVDPVLVVALDSNLMAGELGTNKDLYLTRLSYHGIAISDIRFTVGKRDTKGGAPNVSRVIRRGVPPTYHGELPELSPAEQARVERATQNLPDGLRQSVSRAMCASLRRNKATGA